MQHAAMRDSHDDQPFSETYCEVAASRASVSSRRFLAPAPPSAKVAAASDCAIAIAPVRLGKNPGEDANSINQQVVGTFGHRRTDAICYRNQIGARGVRGPRRLDARGRIGRETDDDHRFPRTESAEIEIFGPGAADQLHLVGSEQAKLVIEQFRDTAAAAKSRNPDAPRGMQRPRCPRDGMGRNTRQPSGVGLQLVGYQGNVRVRPLPPPAGTPRKRRGLRRPARFRERGAQLVPAGIADRLGKAGKCRRIGPGDRSELSHRARGRVIIIGGDETPHLLQPGRQRRQRAAQFVQGGPGGLDHETNVAYF